MTPTDRLLAAYQKQNKALSDQLESVLAQLESMRTMLRHAGDREDAYITTIREQVEFIRLLEGGVPNVA